MDILVALSPRSAPETLNVGKSIIAVSPRQPPQPYLRHGCGSEQRGPSAMLSRRLCTTKNYRLVGRSKPRPYSAYFQHETSQKTPFGRRVAPWCDRVGVWMPIAFSSLVPRLVRRISGIHCLYHDRASPKLVGYLSSSLPTLSISDAERGVYHDCSLSEPATTAVSTTRLRTRAERAES